MYLHAGPEIGVASTKAFTCQVDRGDMDVPVTHVCRVTLGEILVAILLIQMVFADVL